MWTVGGYGRSGLICVLGKGYYSIMRRWLRPLWIALALLFLLEAWLWDHLEPIVARVVNLIPWGTLKDRLARLVERLPPWAVLFVFVIPFIVMLPLKFLGLYFLATRNWLGAIGVGILAKLLGLGLTASSSISRATSCSRWPGSAGCMNGFCGRAIGRMRKPSRSGSGCIDWHGY